MTSRIQDAFETLRVEGTAEIVRVTFDNPPINLLDAAMLDDLDRLGMAGVIDGEVRPG